MLGPVGRPPPGVAALGVRRYEIFDYTVSDLDLCASCSGFDYATRADLLRHHPLGQTGFKFQAPIFESHTNASRQAGD